MLATARVNPLDLEQPSLDLTKRRAFRMALGEGSVFVLVQDIKGVPLVLRIYQLVEFTIAGSVVKWTVKDDRGQWFEGRHQPISLHEHMTAKVEIPLVVTPDGAIFKTYFSMTLPAGLKLYHLNYLKKLYPNLATYAF